MDNKLRNQEILNLTCELLKNINVDLQGAFVEDMENEGEQEQALVNLTVDNPATLIGFRGRNLGAIQLILGLMIKKKMDRWIRVLVDVNNYRQDQKKRLESMATLMAEKAINEKRIIALGSMSSFERRICHMVLKKIEGITEESVGEGEERHIIIKPEV